ncbi:MAG: hypothetical protein ACTSQJ_08735 [Promethearchaeota archaeon]
MKEFEINNKQSEKNKKFNNLFRILGEKQEYQDINKIHLLSSKDLENSIKRLMYPGFLGSIHLNKRAMINNFHTVENLIKGELELKLTKSLKNTIFNPITKALILITLIFNILWFSYLLFF